MPTALRPNKKAREIAWSILGVPANIKYDKSPYSKKIEQKINTNYSTRIKNTPY